MKEKKRVREKGEDWKVKKVGNEVEKREKREGKGEKKKIAREKKKKVRKKKKGKEDFFFKTYVVVDYVPQEQSDLYPTYVTNVQEKYSWGSGKKKKKKINEKFCKIKQFFKIVCFGLLV